MRLGRPRSSTGEFRQNDECYSEHLPPSVLGEGVPTWGTQGHRQPSNLGLRTKLGFYTGTSKSHGCQDQDIVVLDRSEVRSLQPYMVVSTNRSRMPHTSAHFLLIFVQNIICTRPSVSFRTWSTSFPKPKTRMPQPNACTSAADKSRGLRTPGACVQVSFCWICL